MSGLIQLHWVEFQPRPKKDGLHDSGYRFIRLTGVDMEGNRHDMGEWHDHLIVETKCNIDVEADGTIRVMPWSGEPWLMRSDRTFFTSTAWIDARGSFS